MAKKYKRTPRNYNGTQSPIKEIKKIVPFLMNSIDKKYTKQPKRILDMWPEIIGEKLAHMTEAEKFDDGVLTIKVKNSTLYSLLIQNEKERLLKVLQKKFSKEAIHNIVFRIG